MRIAALILLLGLPLAAQMTVVGEGAGGGAPTDATYWLGSANGSLSAEIVVNDIASLEAAISAYDFNDAANLTTGTIPEARIGAFSSLVNINGGFEIADFRCTASAGVMTCQDQTATTGDTLFIVRRGAGESGNVFEVNWGASALDNVAVSSIGTLVGQTNSGGIKYQLVLADSTFRLASDNHIKFNSTTNLGNGALDTGITRSSAGVMKITDASTGYGSIDAAAYRLAGIGAIIYPPSASEPVDCTTSNDGSMYFDTDDQKLCICANDGTDDEWLHSDNYGHLTGHCSI